MARRFSFGSARQKMKGEKNVERWQLSGLGYERAWVCRSPRPAKAVQMVLNPRWEASSGR